MVVAFSYRDERISAEGWRVIYIRTCNARAWHGGFPRGFGALELPHKAGELTGVIDWDLAHFGLPLDDLAFMAIEAVPLRRSTESTMGENVLLSVLMNRLEVLLHAYGKVTVAETLTQADDALGQLIEQTRANAHRNVSPFDEFVQARLFRKIMPQRDYIKRFWIRRTLF